VNAFQGNRNRRHSSFHQSGRVAEWVDRQGLALVSGPHNSKQFSISLAKEITMLTRYVLIGVIGAAAAIAALSQTGPAHALTTTECSAKYKEAKSAGTLNGMTWNDFRKAQCSSGASAAPAASPSAAAPAAPAASATASNAVFPSAVDSKYSKDSAGKARRETCLDQYRANKANNGNGGLKWIQKGGGYYSECTKKLKGAA
jgi:hypothetical protein